MLAPRTRRPYAPKTIRRYEQSWDALFAALPAQRAASLSDIDKSFITRFRTVRIAEGVTGATVNRDLCALQSFWGWLEEERGITPTRCKLKKERESPGCDRWLEAEEIVRLRVATPAEWWPLFAVLLYTGIRVGEAQALRWQDVKLDAGLIAIHDRWRRLKTASTRREVPISGELAAVLVQYRARTCPAIDQPVFGGDIGDYHRARRAFRAALKAAGLAPARVHDLRHTYGVHAAQAGVPLTRLQYLLGHSTPSVTLRYMRHSPNQYLASDAALIAQSMSGNKSGGATPPRLALFQTAERRIA